MAGEDPMRSPAARADMRVTYDDFVLFPDDGNGLVRRLERLRQSGYRVHVVFLWLPTVDLALARVADRVRGGGHGVPAEDVRRRLYDASRLSAPTLVASGGEDRPTRVRLQHEWAASAGDYGHE